MNILYYTLAYLTMAVLFAYYLWYTGEYKTLKTPIMAGLAWIVVIPLILLVCVISLGFLAIAFINIRFFSK